MKETHELRPRVPYSGPTRGIRSASERNMGWSGLIQACYEGMFSLLFSIMAMHIYALRCILCPYIILNLLCGILLVREW